SHAFENAVLKGMHLRAFGVPWHIPHQFDLIRSLSDSLSGDPVICEYGLLRNPWRRWVDEVRPMPTHCRVVNHFDPAEWDVAILHVDHTFAEDTRKSQLIADI